MIMLLFQAVFTDIRRVQSEDVQGPRTTDDQIYLIVHRSYRLYVLWFSMFSALRFQVQTVKFEFKKCLFPTQLSFVRKIVSSTFVLLHSSHSPDVERAD